MKKVMTLVAAASLVAGAAVAIAPTANAAKTVTLAFQGPLTGDYAQLGVDQFPGAQFAIAQYNAKNPKVKVKLIKADSQCDGTVAANVAPGIAANKAVVGVIGTSCSGEAKNSIPSYKAAGLAMVSPSATNVDLTNPNSKIYGSPVFHRVVVNDDLQGPALAKYGVKGVASPKIFIIDDKSTYGAGIAITAKKAAAKLGSIVGEDSVLVPLSDWTSVVSKVKSSGANVVLFCGYDSDAAKFLKTARDNGYTGIFAGPDGVNTSIFPELAGAAAEGARMTAPDVPFDRLVSKATLKEFTKVTKVKVPGLYVTSTYDAANIFLSCITDGDTTRAAILDCVATGTWKGVAGNKISFDYNGDVEGGAAVAGYTVKNGKIIFGQKI